MESGSLYICNYESEIEGNRNPSFEERLHLFDGPFKTLIEAKRTLKERKGYINQPIIIKIVGSYTNYIQDNQMFSNKDGNALPDDTEMKIH
jgi:hypothetical protein